MSIYTVFALKIKNVTIFTFLLGYFVNNAYASSPQVAFNEISSEMSQCAAYYAIGTYCVGESLEATSKRNIDAAMLAANNYAILFGKEASLSNQALLSRNKMFPKSLLNEMDGNCVNIAVLLSKYGESCRLLIEHPDVRLEELINNE